MTLEDALKRRHNFRFFKQTEYPKKEIIDEILKKSIEFAPIKNDIWHFSIDIYGPTWSNEKDDLCIRTSCKYENNFLPWEEQVKLYNKWKKYPLNVSSGLEKYNDQVKAPYLLVYRKSPYHHNPMNNLPTFKDIKTWEKRFDISKDVAAIGAGIHAYVVSILANNLQIDTSFCRCLVDPKKTTAPFNSILQEEQPYFTLGLGYADDELNNKVDKVFNEYKKNMKPELHNVIKWHE